MRKKEKVIDKATVEYQRLPIQDRKTHLRHIAMNYEKSCSEYKKILIQIEEMGE